MTGKATYKGKSLAVATSTATVSGGKGSVTLNPSSATKAALKKVRSLKVTITVTFTPTGGTAAKKTASLTLKGTTHKKKHATHKKKH